MDTVRFIPLSATRTLDPVTNHASYVFVEAVINDGNHTVSFTRVDSEGLTDTFTLSMTDLDEFYAEYDAHVTGDPRPGALPPGAPRPMIDERGVALLQRPRPSL